MKTLKAVLLSNIVVVILMSYCSKRKDGLSGSFILMEREEEATYYHDNNNNNVTEDVDDVASEHDDNVESFPPKSMLGRNTTIEEIISVRERRLSRVDCIYKPDSEINVMQEEESNLLRRRTTNSTNTTTNTTTTPNYYEEIPTQTELHECKSQIHKTFSFNHLPSSPPQYTVYPRQPTFNFDALIKSTYCSVNPNLVQTQTPETCFQNHYFKSIARVPAPSTKEEFFSKYALRALPVIFTNYDPTNDLLWSWDVDGLSERLGKYKMKVRHGNYEELSSREFTTMSIRKFVDIIRGRSPLPPGMPPYLGNNRLDHKLVRKMGYKKPMYHESIHFTSPSLWVGAKGTETPLHKDGPDNFAFMLHGTKRWTIFPPEDLVTLGCDVCIRDKYVDIDGDDPGHLQNGLCWCPDQGVVREGDVLPSSSQPYTFDLKGGEVLYLPAGWLHSVRNLDETVMVNQWLKYKITPYSVWGWELIQFWARGEYQPVEEEEEEEEEDGDDDDNAFE